MDLREQLRQAFEAIADHPGRVVAAALGVYWSAAAIVVLLAVGEGFRVYMNAELGSYGKPMLFVIPGITSSGFPGHRSGVRIRLARADLETAERASAPHVAAILSEHRSVDESRSLVEASGRRRRLDLSGVDHRFAEHRRFAIAHGRFFSAAEVARARAVAVLGNTAARELFHEPGRAVGRSIRIDGVAFEVIGVAAEKGRQYFNTNRPDNRLLLVPVSTAEQRLGYDPASVEFASVILRPGAPAKPALRAVLASLAPKAGFHPDDTDAVRWFDLTNILGMIDLMHAGFTLFIAFAGTITLVVGGIGIANAHLASLAERSVELAVARALGARTRVLVLGAVLESLLVSLATAVAGVATGVAVAQLLARLLAGSGLAPVISPATLVTAVASLTAVSVVAALLPALRVRRTDVSAALRSS
jgi:ABC-type antimicrobial peptide transport system permease subunit